MVQSVQYCGQMHYFSSRLTLLYRDYSCLILRPAQIKANVMLIVCVTRFGENAALLYLLYQFLLDRFKEDDLDGPLTRAILGVSHRLDCPSRGKAIG